MGLIIWLKPFKPFVSLVEQRLYCIPLFFCWRVVAASPVLKGIGLCAFYSLISLAAVLVFKVRWAMAMLACFH